MSGTKQSSNNVALRWIGEAGRVLRGSAASDKPTTRLSPQDLYLSPTVSTSLTAIVGVLRWGAVLVGLVFAAQRAVGEGELRIVGTVAVAIFITSWRTINPLVLGSKSKIWLTNSLGDVVVLAAAMGLREGLSNPLVGTLFVAVAVASFGWGIRRGAIAACLALVVSTLVLRFGGDLFVWPSPVAITALAGATILPGVALDRLLEIEARRRVLVDQRDKLSQTNQLLEVLNDLARTLPSSLDLNDVVSSTRRELLETFEADRAAMLIFEDGTWAPLFQDGFDLAPEVAETDLPEILKHAAQSVDPVRVDDLSTVSERSGSGLYVRLVAQSVDVGLIALEHKESERFTSRDAELLEGMSEVLGLTLANARSFNRLRSLTAAEERSKIARDLHDRLGQYLTYIAIELERINANSPSVDLKVLHEDVQGAVAEFRDTLLELRAEVSVHRPLSTVLAEVTDRFSKRSELDVVLSVPDPTERLPGRVENEFLRIAQEALTNVEKHAMAAKVQISWSIADGLGVLVVQDDGRGFDPAKGIRGNAFGLVGMRERAASVGALLTISSKPGEGTAITVQSSQPSQ